MFQFSLGEREKKKDILGYLKRKKGKRKKKKKIDVSRRNLDS